jgi:hypothetical protein
MGPTMNWGVWAIIVWWGQPWWRTNSIWLIESE